MLWVASGRRGYLVVGLAAVRGRAPTSGTSRSPTCSCASTYWLHALDPAKVHRPGLRAARAGLVRAGDRRAGGHRPRAGLAHADPLRRERLHLRGVRRGARACSAPPRLLLLYLVLIGRGLRIAVERTDALRQAARDRAHDDRRAADVRDRRRACTRLIPLTGVPLPLVSLRRVEPRRDASSWRCWCALGRTVVRAGPPRAPDPRRSRAGVTDGSAHPPAGDRARGAVRGAVRAARVRAGVRGRPHHERPRERQRARSSPSTRSSAGRSSPPTQDGRSPRASQRRRPNSPTSSSAATRRESSTGSITGYLLADLRTHRRSSRSMNPYLSGDAPELALSEPHRPLPRAPPQAGRHRLHDASTPSCRRSRARRSGNLQGAVVAIDPQTGDVLAHVLQPRLRPQPLSSGTADQMQAAWSDVNADPDKPLLAHASQDTLPAGLDVQDR